MPKTIKRCFDKNLTFIKLIEAHERAKKNKMSKKEVLLFEMDLETNITNILNAIQNGTYKMGRYREFKIYEPKERIIKSLPYPDRVVHQWYVEEFIKPYIVPRFIYDSYACITDRGTHKAVERLQYFMRKKYRQNPNYYIVKCDIKSYFYNIDKDILTGIMERYISDKKLMAFTKLMIDGGEKDRIGLPIGNYTSQYFANIYLNELDYYMKFELRQKYYVRYMDDFMILVDNKQEARELLRKINNFVIERLHLELNHKSGYYPRKMGANFCGFRIWETHILIRKRSIKKMKKNVRKWNKGENDGKDILLSYNSWLGHISHGNSYNLKLKINSMMNDDVKKILGITDSEEASVES